MSWFLHWLQNKLIDFFQNSVLFVNSNDLLSPVVNAIHNSSYIQQFLYARNATRTRLKAIRSEYAGSFSCRIEYNDINTNVQYVHVSLDSMFKNDCKIETYIYEKPFEQNDQEKLDGLRLGDIDYDEYFFFFFHRKSAQL